MDVTPADILNANLQAPSSQRCYIVCGPEFGLENVGKKALIRHALYVVKTSGRDFWNHLQSCMHHLGFESCKVDPEVWMQAAKKEDGTKYSEYALLYTDDVMVVSERGEKFLRNELGNYFELKEESIIPPKIYLGGSMSKVVLRNSLTAWSFSSSHYVQTALKNVKESLAKQDAKFPDRATHTLILKLSPLD